MDALIIGEQFRLDDEGKTLILSVNDEEAIAATIHLSEAEGAKLAAWLTAWLQARGAKGEY